MGKVEEGMRQKPAIYEIKETEKAAEGSKKLRSMGWVYVPASSGCGHINGKKEYGVL